MADKRQRKINQWVRVQNRALATDEFLGPGRFSMRQLAFYGREWYDRLYLFELRDNQTGQTIGVWATFWNLRRELYWQMNDFIIDVRNREGW
jgi:hypothetical protein